MVKYYNH